MAESQWPRRRDPSGAGDLFQVCGLPGITVCVPCDALQTQRATEALLFDVQGPGICASPARPRRWSPAPTRPTGSTGQRDPLPVGERERFADAFETRLAADHRDEHEDLTLVACGPVLAEAMRAA